MLEFILVFFSKFQVAMWFLLGIIGIVLTLYFMVVCEYIGEEQAQGIKRIKQTLLFCLVPIFIILLPNPKDMTEMRITLIKYRLTSPENIQKATETIERIGKKLECKYLDCKD